MEKVKLSLIMIGLWVSVPSWAEPLERKAPSENKGKSQVKVVYPKKTSLDFEGAQIEGELRNPGEFYFQHRSEEKFDSLVKRKKNFHREMMRDVVLSK